MYKGQQCQFCDLPFDAKDRIPRVLNLCEHLICEKCIKEHIKRGFPITCDQDGIVYNVKFDSLDDFKEDKQLLQTLQNGIMEKEEEYDNSSDQNSVVISNDDILSEGNSENISYDDHSNIHIDSQNDSQSIKLDLKKKTTNDSQSDFMIQQNKEQEYDDYSVKNSMMDDFNPVQDNQIQMNSSISAISQNQDDQVQINPPQYDSESEEDFNNPNYIDDRIDSFDSEENIPRNQKMKFCTLHNMKQEEICLECATRICAKCAVYGVHQNHNRRILPERIFYEEVKKYKSDIDKWLNKIKQQDEYLKYEFVESTFKKESYQKQQELQQEIDQIYKKAFNQLQKQKDLLVANMKDRFISKQKYLQDEINASVQQMRPQILSVSTELTSIKSSFSKKQNEKALFQIMRDKEEINIRNSVKDIVQIQKQQYQKFSKKATNFIDNAKLVKNQDLNFDIAQLKTEALINDTVFLGSDGDELEEDDDEEMIDLRETNFHHFQNGQRQPYNNCINQSQLEYQPQPRQYQQRIPQPIDPYQMNQNPIMHQSMIDPRANGHYRSNTTIGFKRNQQYLNQTTFYPGQQSPGYEKKYQQPQQNSIIYDDLNSMRNSFNGSNSKNKLMRKNTFVEKNQISDRIDSKMNSDLVRKIQTTLMGKATTLDLNNQKIKDDDIFTITQMIQKKSNLKNLILKRNRFTDKAIQILCKELIGTNLKIIDVSNNNLSTKSLNHMLKLAEKNSKIKKIIFKDIPMKLKDKKTYQDFFKKLNVIFSIQLIYIIFILINNYLY